MACTRDAEEAQGTTPAPGPSPILPMGGAADQAREQAEATKYALMRTGRITNVPMLFGKNESGNGLPVAGRTCTRGERPDKPARDGCSRTRTEVRISWDAVGRNAATGGTSTVSSVVPRGVSCRELPRLTW